MMCMKKTMILLCICIFSQHLQPSPLTVTCGGTNLTTLTANNMLIGNDTDSITLLAPSATSGVPLVSQGSSADPAYTTMSVSGGGTGLTSTTAYAILTGGITSTDILQQASGGVGSLNQVLSSADGSAVPIWNGQIQQATVVLTSAQVKSLNATPITIVPAPGAGYVINPLVLTVKKKYGGTNVWTAAAAQTLRLNYTNGAGTTIFTTALSNLSITSANDRIAAAGGLSSTSGSYSSIGNQPIVILNPVATEISGNAANNNTITINLLYSIVTI